MRQIIIVLIITLFLQILQAQKPHNEIVKYDVECRVGNNNYLLVKVSTVIQINSRKGENLSKIGVYYQKSDPLIYLNATLKDKTGKIIRELKMNDIEEVSTTLTGTLYSDYYMKVFQLKHNEYPYQIHYSYALSKASFF